MGCGLCALHLRPPWRGRARAWRDLRPRARAQNKKTRHSHTHTHTQSACNSGPSWESVWQLKIIEEQVPGGDATISSCFITMRTAGRAIWHGQLSRDHKARARAGGGPGRRGKEKKKKKKHKKKEKGENMKTTPGSRFARLLMGTSLAN